VAGTKAARRKSIMSSFESRAKVRRKAQLSEYACRMRSEATPTEQALWAAIRGSALGVTFRRQVPIGGSFIADFFASEVRLVVEVDGTWHANREAADARRDRKLQQLGFTVVRLSAVLVQHHLPLALQRIREAIAHCRSNQTAM
jgi:very-short-patch-repair endonuclease